MDEVYYEYTLLRIIQATQSYITTTTTSKHHNQQQHYQILNTLLFRLYRRMHTFKNIFSCVDCSSVL